MWLVFNGTRFVTITGSYCRYYVVDTLNGNKAVDNHSWATRFEAEEYCDYLNDCDSDYLVASGPNQEG